MSAYNYKALLRRGKIKLARRGCRNTPALVLYESIPYRFKEKITELVGDPYETSKTQQFLAKLEPDPKAAKFFSEYTLEDGRRLTAEQQRKYRTSVELLNTIDLVITDRTAFRKALGGSKKNMWERLSVVINSLPVTQYSHNLPMSSRRLQQKYKDFKKGGITTVIHKGHCNTNSRKVTQDIEQLILSLYCLPNKPYSTTIHQLYMQFLGGAIEVFDQQTGELFDPADFYDENNQPVTLSDATIWNYINDPKNRSIVDRSRNGQKYFNDRHRPHHHRHKPFFSLSKVSLDDRDLPRKVHEGGRVKSYYAYDVASECLIGAAYSRKKDKPLFIACLRDMFRFINKNGLGIPMEMEVEHHLVNQFKDDLFKAGTVFPLVRWCAPGNSQEKDAEHMIRRKKYGFEKMHQSGIGRFYLKQEANKITREKIFDEDNDNFKEPTYSYEQLIADDIFINSESNNSLHSNQKKYPGLTRLEVFIQHANPDLAPYDQALIVKYIGEVTSTTIRRSQYVTVNYNKYQIESVADLKKLKPNNLQVQAYWLPSDTKNVYLYQGEEFICAAARIITYNTARAERTQKDVDAFINQRKFVKAFDAEVKKSTSKKISKLQLLYSVNAPDTDEPIEIVAQSKSHDIEDENEYNDDTNYIQRAIDEL